MNIHDKLDKLIDKQDGHGIILAKMEVDLAHHIKRSDIQETRIDNQDKKINKIWYVLIAGVAAGMTEYSPVLLKWLGTFL